MSNQAQLNQSLYFARLQIEAGEQIQSAKSARFGVQVQQCYSDAALEQLYRALFFAAQIVLANTSDAQQLPINPLQLNQVVRRAALHSPAPLLNRLARMLALGGELYELPALYLARWKDGSGKVAVQIDLVQSDKPSMLEQCRYWHDLLSEFNLTIAEQSAEY